MYRPDPKRIPAGEVKAFYVDDCFKKRDLTNTKTRFNYNNTPITLYSLDVTYYDGKKISQDVLFRDSNRSDYKEAYARYVNLEGMGNQQLIYKNEMDRTRPQITTNSLHSAGGFNVKYFR